MSGGGCKTCPVKDCDAQYRGSRCAALRAKARIDSDPLTNADRIRGMSDEELAEWILMEILKIVEEPIWCDSHCEDSCDHERECVKSWLQQPAPEEGEQL